MINSSTGSTVVPATASTTTRSEPANAFRSEDLPTFGRPRSATRLGPPARDVPCPTAGNIFTMSSIRSPEPWPCSADTGSGSPRPSDQSFVASISVARSSTLLATSSTGLPERRRTLTTASSVSVAPTRASTTNTTASASLTARSACAAICACSPRTFKSQPPVSITMKRLLFHSAS